VPDYLAALEQPIAGLRVAVPERYFFDELDPEVEAGVRAAVRVIQERGATVGTVTLPHVEAMMTLAHLIARAESATVHACVLRERPDDLQPAVRSRLSFGFTIPAADYLQALRVRPRLTREFVKEVFARHDVVLTPVVTEPAPTVASVSEADADAVVARMRSFSRCTRPFNTLGLPALSVPCGFSRAGLPLAIQLVGRPFDEATVLRVGHAYEQATGWARRQSPLDADAVGSAGDGRP
jgi:aspartyl-tRNA(Asn)/glutamyl-tRNA(Gln) amidotransferase subunit A